MFKTSGTARGRNILIEILMIVIGINVALWFEGWFQNLEDRETESRYLADLRNDLVTDIDNLEKLIEWADRKSETAGKIAERLPTLETLSPEQLAQVVGFPSSYQFFTPSDFTYRSMQESGDFRLLTNDAIKKEILRLDRRHKDIAALQTNYLQALDDGYIPLMMNAFDLASNEVTDPALLEDQLFRNIFAYVGNDTRTMATNFRDARAKSEKLIYLIDQQLGK
jgi:hypothetical protein